VKRMVSPLPIAVGLTVIALVALLVYGVNSSGPSRTLDSQLAQGRKPAAPRLELTSLSSGRPTSLAAYRGKVVLLNIWASWCTPCRTESPLLERWHKLMQPLGGTVLGVDTLDIKSDALGFIAKNNLTYPQLNDRDGTSIKKLGTAQYPESFVVDKQGRITALQRGPVDDAWLRAHVLPLLQPAS
jgi:cytochrome c biogenesis protein CcmG/thiol:disulfide interchange protein DsbE